jgi:3-phenylpropionate/trans-cinnamate dioxygenase ferredoxin reductase component
MTNYKYLIVGSGMTADAAVRGIRELDPGGEIGMIGNDHDPPYNRPPLTKNLWKGKPLERIWRRTQEFSVDLFLGRTILSIEPDKKLVRDDQGTQYKYKKLLLATGGTPRRLPFGPQDIIYYRTLDDYRHLRDMSEHSERFGVIGGGFIGSEIAAALAMNGKKVTMFFPDNGIGARIYPAEISNYLNEFFRQKGVEINPGISVQDIQKQADAYHIITDKDEDVSVDGVVAGIGLQPNVDLARTAGLQIGNGIVVDECLQTSHADIFAAGDVAEFYNPTLDTRLRLEHEDNANSMGKQAGRNMAGDCEPYTYLPYFYSDLFELGYEAVGELDSRMETVVDWKDPYKKGVVYYLVDRRVRGVLLWNVWDTIPSARNLIAQPGPFTAGDLVGRL